MDLYDSVLALAQLTVATAGAIYWVIYTLCSIISSLPIFSLEVTYFCTIVIPQIASEVISYAIVLWMRFTPLIWFYEYVACPPPMTLFFFWVYPQSRFCFLYNSIGRRQPVLSPLDAFLAAFLCWLVCCIIVFLSGLSLRHRFQEVLMDILTPRGSPGRDPDALRSAFSSIPLTKARPAENHTHPMCAADRSAASSTIDAFAGQVGLTAYYAQMSKSDQRRGRLGSRVAYWAKDLAVRAERFDPPENSLLAMVDVDQYVDMPSALCDNFCPFVLYTFQPGQVARSVPEYNYTFSADNTVVYQVAGGGRYVHHVWNYSADNLMVSKTFFGIPYKVATYLVDRRVTMLDHELILLTPLIKWTSFWSIIVCWLIVGKYLARLRVATGKYLRLQVNGPKGLLISTGKVGEYAQATIPAEEDNTLSTIAQTSKYDLTLPQAQAAVDGDRVAGAVLMDYHRSKSGDKPDVVCPVEDSVRRYQFNPVTFEPSAKSLMTPFMCPFTGNCFVPDNCLSSERTAVDQRVIAVKPEDIPLTNFLRQCITEFAERLIPVPHQGFPVDVDYLMQQQDKPTQRRILEVSQGCLATLQRHIESFLKKEPYAELKAPRVISPINGVDKAAYALFMYALVDNVLKKQFWYAFSRGPMAIAQRVADVCGGAKMFVVNTDFSKFDGHCSNVFRELERHVLLRAFRHEYHGQLSELHGAQYGLKAYTPGGVSYYTWYTRASGSPETSAFNSIDNAFVSYLAMRMNQADGSFMSPSEAWAALGVYGGDDGLSADLDPDTFKRAAKAVGQVVTVEIVKRGSLGVKFLARTYSPNVWHGDLNTCCDLPRQLSKFHVTVALAANVTPIDKLLEKCRSYWLTDENTPIIGDYVKRARFLLNSDFEVAEKTVAMRAWGSDIAKEFQYRNDPADWMEDYAIRSMPGVRITQFREWLKGTTALADLLTPPLLLEPTVAKSTIPVVVQGVVQGPTVIAALPPVEVAKKEKQTPAEFAVWKADRIARGKWVDKPLPKAPRQESAGKKK